jgi:hypothetical protein
MFRIIVISWDGVDDWKVEKGFLDHPSFLSRALRSGNAGERGARLITWYRYTYIIDLR